jgi:hypothetical protein
MVSLLEALLAVMLRTYGTGESLFLLNAIKAYLVFYTKRLQHFNKRVGKDDPRMRLRDLYDIKQHHPRFTMVLEMDRECDESLVIWRRPSVGGKVQLAIKLLLYQVSKSLSFC